MDELLLTLIAAVLNGVSLAVGMVLGTRLTGRTLRKEIKNFSDESPTAQMLIKFLKQADKLFGDDQLVEQVTKFFKEASDLVSSPEAKNFFKNITDLVKDLGGDEKDAIQLPEKPEVND